MQVSDIANITYFRRALDKREYFVIIRHNFQYFSIKLYIVTPHLNRLDGNDLAILFCLFQAVVFILEILKVA